MTRYEKSMSQALAEVQQQNEKYDLYHKTFSGAMQHAYDYAQKKLGITVDKNEIDRKVATGPRKPSEGKTNKYRLKGKGGNLQIQVYNKGGSKPFELNMYKEDLEIKEGTWAMADERGDAEKLKKLMSKKFKLGKDGEDATDQLYRLLGDDELFDSLYVAGSKNPNGDARPVIINWFKDRIKSNAYNTGADAKALAKKIGLKKLGESVEVVEEVLPGHTVQSVEYKFKDKNEAMKAKKVLLKYFNSVNDEDINNGIIEVDAGSRSMNKAHEEIMKKFRPKVLSGRKINRKGDVLDMKKDERFTKKDFRDNEDKNHHTENGLELVNMFGTSAEKSKMAAIALRHKMNRSISGKDQKDRDALVKKYYPKLKEEVELDEKFKVGDKVKTSGFPGVITKVHTDVRKGMVDVKLKRGTTTVSNYPKLKEEVELGEALDKKDEPKVKEIIKKLKGASAAHAGQAKDLEKAVKEAKFSDDMINKLKKVYEPMKGKKINPTPLMKIFDKIDSNKDGLEQLYKADIPFVSMMAMSRLMLKHNYKAADINKLGKIRREDFVLDEALKGFKVEFGKGNTAGMAVYKDKKDAEAYAKRAPKPVKITQVTVKNANMFDDPQPTRKEDIDGENEMTEKLTSGNLSLKETVLKIWQEAVSPEQQAAIAISKKEKEKEKNKVAIEGKRGFIISAKKAKENGDKTFTFAGKEYDVEEVLKNDNTNDVSDDGDGLDKVQPKAVKKKFKDRKDKDIDNDGDVDSTDKYLHKRRKAISKAIEKESKKEEFSTPEWERYLQTKKGSLRDTILTLWGENAHSDDEGESKKKDLTKDKNNDKKKMTDTGKEVTPVDMSPKMPKVKNERNKL